jgi:hypothetical protein
MNHRNLKQCLRHVWNETNYFQYMGHHGPWSAGPSKSSSKSETVAWGFVCVSMYVLLSFSFFLLFVSLSSYLNELELYCFLVLFCFFVVCLEGVSWGFVCSNDVDLLLIYYLFIHVFIYYFIYLFIHFLVYIRMLIYFFKFFSFFFFRGCGWRVEKKIWTWAIMAHSINNLVF